MEDTFSITELYQIRESNLTKFTKGNNKCSSNEWTIISFPLLLFVTSLSSSKSSSSSSSQNNASICKWLPFLVQPWPRKDRRNPLEVENSIRFLIILFHFICVIHNWLCRMDKRTCSWKCYFVKLCKIHCNAIIDARRTWHSRRERSENEYLYVYIIKMGLWVVLEILLKFGNSIEMSWRKYLHNGMIDVIHLVLEAFLLIISF